MELKNKNESTNLYTFKYVDTVIKIWTRWLVHVVSIDGTMTVKKSQEGQPGGKK